MAAPRNYWMVSVSPEFYQATRDRHFDMLGMGRAQKKRVQRMEVGDRVLYYVSDWQVFAATATIDSTYFEDHQRVWGSSDPHEEFPWRVRLRSNVVLKEKGHVDARLVAPRMQYVRKWVPEQWPLAFLGALHLVPKEDFFMLEDEMRKRTLRPRVEVELRDDAWCALDSLPMAR